MRLTMAAILLLSAILSCACVAQYKRPRRPEPFDNTDFMKKVQGRYVIFGRGRFGKRQMHITHSSVILKETPFFENSDNDLFKNLGFK